MNVESRIVVIYDVDSLVQRFYRELDAMGCPVGMTLPDAVITTAIMNQVLGYSPLRGTSQLRVREEMEVFGVPSLVAEDLFLKLCAGVKAHIETVCRRSIFQTDFFWKFVDNNTSVVVIER